MKLDIELAGQTPKPVTGRRKEKDEGAMPASPPPPSRALGGQRLRGAPKTAGGAARPSGGARAVSREQRCAAHGPR